MDSFHDKDIQSLHLSETEKNGLQVFRNYQRSFEEQRIRTFIEKANKKSHDLNDLKKLLKLVESEDQRFLPVIACSFADDRLKRMFKEEIPSNVPGGKSSMLGSFGCLSRFSQRLQIAYAFNWISPDIIEELEKLRKIRNKASHHWDLDNIQNDLETLVTTKMMKIEEHIKDQEIFGEALNEETDNEKIFRIRLTWLLGRCYYESVLYAKAYKEHLDPGATLYGSNQTELLKLVAKTCLEATNNILEK